MAIQVWDGTKYVGAELGRFGPSGTLKEALVWDGTKYIKVWPNTPPSIYPVSGTWAGNTTPTVTVLATHTIAEDGVYSLTWAVTWAGTGSRIGVASLAQGAPPTAIGSASPLTSAPGSSTGTATAVALSAGELISFRAVTSVGTFPATGAWTITKV